MSAGDIFSKTDLGVQEVVNRKMKLSPRVRTMLILIDGNQPAFILREEAKKVGAPDDFLEQLTSLGLVQKSGVTVGPRASAGESVTPPDSATSGDEFSRFRFAKDFMNVSIVNAMGIKSFFFTLKLERAGNRSDLKELVGAYEEALTKASGPEEARVLVDRLKAML
jgi:hypothetical protein